MQDAAEALAAHKVELRARLLAARRERTEDSLEQARHDIRTRIVERVRTEGWRCVAAYEPLATEPGSPELLAELTAHGVRVLVPVLLPDKDLDWAELTAAGRGAGSGMDAIAGAQAVFVPALAVAHDGTRLGRGGGSYDRALARTTAPAFALLFDDEVVPELPRAPWDLPVAGAVTPAKWLELPRPERATGMPSWP
jgi:5-formyltetrahydrofolate cyclo-ligase